MAATATNGNGKTRRADRRDGVTDQRIIARILEMREQGYGFGDIAAALAKQGLIGLSPERVRDIIEAYRVRKE
jgi:hypothetical protein